MEACQLLIERGVAFKCVIGGAGPQFDLLAKLVQKYQLQDVIELPGTIFQEQLRNYLESATMFVLPCVVADDGDMDGIPVVLMEAMAMQVPVISTTVSGVPELVMDGQTGLLVPPKDVEALAIAITRYLDDPAFAVRMGIAGRQTIESSFNLHNSSKQLEQLFTKYLSKPAHFNGTVPHPQHLPQRIDS